MLEYSLQDVKDNLPTTSYSRGRDYYDKGKVLEISFDYMNSSISGIIAGSSKRPYRAVIKVKEGKGANRISINGRCTCPMISDCKHIAALLLASLEADNSNMPGETEAAPIMDLSIASWLNDIKNVNSEYKPKKRLCYILSLKDNKILVDVVSVDIKKNGDFGKSNKYTFYVRSKVPNYMDFKDITLVNMLDHTREWIFGEHYCILSGAYGASILKEMVGTGKCYFENLHAGPLSFAEEKSTTLRWTSLPDGAQKIVCESDNFHTLALNPLWYIDTTTSKCGYLNANIPMNLAEALLKSPHIPPQEIKAVHGRLSSLGLQTQIELPKVFASEERIKGKPVPELTLYGTELKSYFYGSQRSITLGIAKISYNYEDINVPISSVQPNLTKLDDDKLIYISRNMQEERRLLSFFKASGEFISVRRLSNSYNVTMDIMDDFTMCEDSHNKREFDSEEKWINFMNEQLGKLRKSGWQVKIEPSFPHSIIYPDSDWEAVVDESSGIDWFSLSIGITADGKQIDLLPVLLQVLKSNHNIFEQLDSKKSEIFLVNISPKTKLALPTKRLLTILTFLKDLFGSSTMGEDGKLKLSQFESAHVLELELAMKALGVRWLGGERIKHLGNKLKTFEGITAVEAPKLLKADLRPYQKEGLNWLQFLREYELAGILADDMGLGKTIQTLASIMVEKEQNRLNLPTLVIAPTSVIGNWHIEINKFAPNLKTLLLHGIERKQKFSDIAEHDIVLTTYALLPRDKETLLKQDFHTVILDEAQYIKNPKAQLTQVINQLKTTNRLCLTGTPLENHLGELWSLFNFLMPGLLGTLPEFNKFYRNPIERNNDDEQRQRLVRRIKPFILRRTKERVVTELPAKTEIIQVSTLSKVQADLYETIRVSMHSKIQKEIATKGLARSHIIILDALIKLRQVCCHPKLLKSTVTKKVNESSKLEQLIGMVQPMLEEGRKILIFSQFVGMLSLIEEQLVANNIQFAKLTGQTKDRQSQITKFQMGEVDVFLISLKAGGTGINLTAADTVIHYDPWWNPATERQATDRAHRIGQDKPVFVYKMITTNTVEEKILEMQKRKAALAEGIFDPDSKAAAKLSVEDINSLFAPLYA